MVGSGVANFSGAESDEHLIKLWISTVARSEATARAYRGNAAAFTQAMAKPLARVTLADLDQWATELTGAPRTRAQRVNSIKSLFTFAHRCGYLQFNVGAALRAPSTPTDVMARILTEQETIRLLDAPTSPRDRALLRFLYSSGCRIAEAMALNWQNIQPSPHGPVVSILGKGGKWRYVTVSQGTADELLALRGDVADDAPVFTTSEGRMTTRTGARIVEQAAEAAKIKKAVSPHWLRHCCASHSLDRGAPLHTVQASLGHSSVTTTERYLHARPGDGAARYLAV